jgi:hypothetical protein
MSTKSVALIGGVVIAATAVTVARKRAATSSSQTDPRWKVVSVNASAGEAARAALPAPLVEIRDLIDIRITDAPGRHGVELAARPVPHTAHNKDLEGQIRRALRESKQLLEVGYVMSNHPQPEGHRPSTLPGIAVDHLVRQSPESGVL